MKNSLATGSFIAITALSSCNGAAAQSVKSFSPMERDQSSTEICIKKGEDSARTSPTPDTARANELSVALACVERSFQGYKCMSTTGSSPLQASDLICTQGTPPERFIRIDPKVIDPSLTDKCAMESQMAGDQEEERIREFYKTRPVTLENTEQSEELIFHTDDLVRHRMNACIASLGLTDCLQNYGQGGQAAWTCNQKIN